MAIKKVKAKSGEMFDVNSPQGKTIVASATVGKDADFNASRPGSNFGADVSMTETLQLIYGETQDSAESLDNIEEALVEGTEETTEERAARLKKSNKEKAEKKPNRFGKALGAAGSAIGTGFGKVKSSLSGKVGLALLGGGLLLLNKYGDEIAGPDGWLTRFLKYMKENFIPDIRALYETVTGEGGLTEKLKKDFDDAWAGMTGFLAFFSEIGTTIATYVKKFDTNDDGILSGDEAKVMWTEIWDDIKSSLWNLTKESAIALVSGIGLISITKAALTALFTSGKGFAAIGTGAGVAGLGILGTAALVGVVAGGLWLLAEKVSGAYDDAVTDAAGNPQNFKTKEFLARFFGGANEEGGFFNALTTGMESALIGGAAGAAVGSAVPGIGTAVGAVVGALIFGVIGVTGGAAGKKKIETWLDGFEIKYNETVNAITGGFDRLVKKAKAIITPGVSQEDVDLLLDAGSVGSNLNRETKQGEIDDNNKKIGILQEELNQGKTERTWYWSKSLFGEDLPYADQILALKQRNFVLSGELKSIPIDPVYEAEKSRQDKQFDIVDKKVEDVASFGFRATNYAMSIPGRIADIDSKDLYKFAFGGSLFDRDFEAEDNAELMAARAAGYALEGAESEIPGVPRTDKGNITDYRRMIKINKAKFKDGSMPRITAQMSLVSNVRGIIEDGVAKQLKKEMRADAAKENKFTTFNSRDQRTSTEINQANYVAGMSARNDFWQEYYGHKAATN